MATTLSVRENPTPANPLLRWELIEEKGVRERLLAAYPVREVAEEAMRRENARRAQRAIGTVGTFYGEDSRDPTCTCPREGIMLEAVACPVHDV